MSGFGGFGGFGSSTNNQQQSSGFGGFGNTTNTNSGFGGTANASNTPLFGGSSTTAGGFGSGGFGSGAASSPFGQNKSTGFGTTTSSSGGGLFGNNTATSGTGFGGFGGGGGGGGTTSAFGGGTSGSTSLFGQSKPAFGGTTGATGGSMFGNTSTGFGSGAATSTPAFGAGASTSFGGTPAQNNGTATTPFSEHVEKDPAAANTQNKYQTISAMQPYQGFSLEELRLADYAQGRKQGNQNGQAGAFGSSTGFGGFGAGTGGTSGFGGTSTSTGGGLFGNNNNTTTTSTFGQSANTGFGSGATGGLFGAKPAATGLFGNTAATSGQTSGGLFGTSAPAFGAGASTGFGANTGTATTGGLFGSTAAKPAFGGFGTGNTTGSGFGTGAAASTGGSNLFGGGTTAPTTGFGTQQQSTSTPFSFGQTGQQTQQTGQTTGLFGNFGAGAQTQQQKPGGLFGSTTTGTSGGLFGQQPAQQPASGTSLFGSSTQQQQSGGLFGNKTGGGLFGNTATGTTGGLFGGTQPQQAQSGGLFGQSAQPQQSGGLFGNKPAAATGGLGSSLFGQTQQQQPTGGLFGGSQQQQSGLGNSLFGNSQTQQPQQQQMLHASINENPYGNDSLFASIQTPQRPVGPLVTPLSSSQSSRKQAIIPSWKINPSSANRLITPQSKPKSYGFSYSTYGTPGSAVGSPTAGSHLLGNGLNRSLNKSVSTSNLRHSFSAQDSILVPGAFTSTARRGGSSLKKLNINSNMTVRRPLFASDDRGSSPVVKKSVSFEGSTSARKANGTPNLGPGEGQLVRVESPEVETIPTGPADSERPQTNGSAHGNELAKIPEDGLPPAGPVREGLSHDQKDQAPGAYYMRPSEHEIKRMTARQKGALEKFIVGRHGVGFIEFSKVNLNEVNLDDIFGNIVVLELRSATVYQEKAVKPPVGKGLNVPSIIELENSWPKAHGGATRVFEKKGPRYEKHIKRLKRIQDTEFVSYDPLTGRYRFKVEHYTTYTVDYDDDDEDESMLDTSTLTQVPEGATPLKGSQNMALTSPPLRSDTSLPSPPESSPDDTFDFKKGRRKNLPGQFDEEDMYDEDMSDEQEDVNDNTQSFLDERSVGSLGETGDDAMSQMSESDSVTDQEMAGSFPAPVDTTEQSLANSTLENGPSMPKSILKASQAPNAFGTPLKTGPLAFGADWTEQLQRTASPRKQDRQALRAIQSSVYKQSNEERDVTPKVSRFEKPFANSMDIMNALFNHTKEGEHGKFSGSSRGFDNPYAKRTKVGTGAKTLLDQDASFHNTTKPSWGPDGTLVYTVSSIAPRLQEGVMVNFGTSLVGAHTDLRFAKLNASHDLISKTISEQQSVTELSTRNNVPYAKTQQDFRFDVFSEQIAHDTSPAQHEKHVWSLAHILFDRVTLKARVVEDHRAKFESMHRKELVVSFWKKLVYADAKNAAAKSKSPEEAALQYLSGGMVEEACGALLEGSNYHLATLVSQVGGDKTFRETIATQLDSWRSLNVLSEFSDEVRAIYEILAGTTSTCKGSTGSAIEDRVSEFTISSRFGLDWRRSFGLRLWYGIEANDDVEEAVRKFMHDLAEGSEKIKPTSCFAQHIAEPNPRSSDDVLWSVLKLYSGLSTEPIQSMFAPESTSGNLIDARLSFQLINLFRARELGLSDETDSAADSIAITFAAGLATAIPKNAQALVQTCWVLLHISDPQAREHSIRTLLDQHVSSLIQPNDQVFNDLCHLQIPQEWMHLSKALYARAVTRNPVAEAHSLIDAKHWTEAHGVVCKVIGPRAVIEENSDQLRELLGALVEERSGKDQMTWNKGAGLYYDYIEMKDLKRGQKWKDLVGRLSKALGGVMNDGLHGRDLTERAALQMMGAAVAEATASGDVGGKAEGLRLPLTEDAYLKHSRVMALDYFKAVLVGH